MFGDTIFSFLFETLSGSMPDRKSHAYVPILRDPPMIPLCDGLNGGWCSLMRTALCQLVNRLTLERWLTSGG